MKFNGAEVASFNKDEVLITPLPLPHISYVVCAEVTFDIVVPKEKRLPLLPFPPLKIVKLIIAAGSTTIKLHVKNIPDDQLEPLRAALA